VFFACTILNGTFHFSKKIIFWLTKEKIIGKLTLIYTKLFLCYAHGYFLGYIRFNWLVCYLEKLLLNKS
jgi:hypothetical protein